jgi:hypothetical protein
MAYTPAAYNNTINVCLLRRSRMILIPSFFFLYFPPFLVSSPPGTTPGRDEQMWGKNECSYILSFIN